MAQKQEEQGVDYWVGVAMDDIADGYYDEYLRDLNEAIVARIKLVREAKAQRNARTMKKGDRVRLTTGLRPKYLQGLTGIATVITPYKITVELDNPYLARRYARPDATLIAPASCVEAI